MEAAIKIVEVGPRDGLQNEQKTVSTETKVALVNALSNTGLKHIEVSSFVDPRWVPQLADAAEVFAQISTAEGVVYSALVPNLQGFDAALAANVTEIAVFAAASETFSHKNSNCSVDQALQRITQVVESASEHKVKVRAYLSCVLGCPYEGDVALAMVADLSRALLDLGCYEISLGDTIGVGTPDRARMMLKTVCKQVPMNQLAVHFHDTTGQALANTYACIKAGVTTVDASVAGLGGCPYAPGASGNLASEDLVYMLEGMGLSTGVDLPRLIEAGNTICRAINRTNASKVAQSRNKNQ